MGGWGRKAVAPVKSEQEQQLLLRTDAFDVLIENFYTITRVMEFL